MWLTCSELLRNKQQSKPSCLAATAVALPANFFWDISVRFLSWEYWDFWRWHDHFRRFPKKSEVFRRSPKFSEDVRSLPKTSEVCRRRNFHLLFTSKIRDREEGIVIYSFYTWFSFLTWVCVNIFLEIVSSKTATTHIFQSGVINWPASVSRREIEVFNPQAWDSHLRRESWQVYSTVIWLHSTTCKNGVTLIVQCISQKKLQLLYL